MLNFSNRWLVDLELMKIMIVRTLSKTFVPNHAELQGCHVHVLEIDFRIKFLYTSIQCFNFSNISDICGEDMSLYVMVVFI